MFDIPSAEDMNSIASDAYREIHSRQIKELVSTVIIPSIKKAANDGKIDITIPMDYYGIDLEDIEISLLKKGYKVEKLKAYSCGIDSEPFRWRISWE